MAKDFVQRIRDFFASRARQDSPLADWKGRPALSRAQAGGAEWERQSRRFARVDLADPAMAALFALALRQAAASRQAGLAQPRPPRRGLDDSEVPSGRTGNFPSARELAEREAAVVSLPEVLVRLARILRDPAGRLDEAVTIIGQDVSLSTRLLKLVNSAFYRRLMESSRGAGRGRYETLARAVSVVGARQVATLALGVAIMNCFKDVPRYLIETPAFWRHSVACGVMARALAFELGEPDEERLFAAGLLHDVGRLVLFRHLPMPSRDALALAKREEITLTMAERRMLGFDHAELGGLVLAAWGYPPQLVQAVAGHHDPGRSAEPRTAAILGAADLATIALEIGSSGERLVPEPDPTWWKTILPGPDALERAVDRAASEIDETVRCLVD